MVCFHYYSSTIPFCLSFTLRLYIYPWATQLARSFFWVYGQNRWFSDIIFEHIITIFYRTAAATENDCVIVCGKLWRIIILYFEWFWDFWEKNLNFVKEYFFHWLLGYYVTIAQLELFFSLFSILSLTLSYTNSMKISLEMMENKDDGSNSSGNLLEWKSMLFFKFIHDWALKWKRNENFLVNR